MINKNTKKKIKKIIRRILKSKAAASILGYLIFLYAKFVGYTTKWKIYGLENILNIWNKGENFIFVGWHGRALMIPFLWHSNQKSNIHNNQVNALVSLHQDGRLIAGLLNNFGISTIDGSSNENAKGAALGLMRSLKNNKTIAIIPDGPCGPNMIMNSSPIYYAHKTGRPIIAINYSIKNSKIIEKAWDKMMVPMPFSEGIFTISEPFYVPENATPEELEKYRLDLEKKLQDITKNADLELGRKPITPGGLKSKKKIREK